MDDDIIGLYYIPLIPTLPIPECATSEGYVQVFSSGGRKVKQYGYEYDYLTKSIYKPAESFPPELVELASIARFECLARGLIDHTYEFNQCIINKYEVGEGISAHSDLHKYGKVIACFSFGGGAYMHFMKNQKPDSITNLYVEPSSLYIMSGPSRYEYTHEMKRRKTDMVNGRRINRSTRYSITFRNVPNKKPGN